jgi:hypothetical protein
MIDYSNELDGIVYTVVPRPPYPEPTPTLDAKIAAKRDEIKGLKENRPATKQAYLLQLQTLNQELDALVEQNGQIRADNITARSAVDAAYQADIETAKQDPTNQWAAIRIVRNRLLAECDWTQVLDAPFSEDESAAWKTYRQALRDIPQAYATPDEVVWPDQPY